MTRSWEVALMVALCANAVLGFAYRVYRLRRGGPKADVTGGALLAAVLAALAWGVASGASWGRWGALVYGILFGAVVTPLWILAVFIPMRPGALDKAYVVVYVASLGAIVVTALAAA